MRASLTRPGTWSPDQLNQLRYTLSFAKLTTIRNQDGEDIDVAEAMGPHRWLVSEALRPHLEPSHAEVSQTIRTLPKLLSATAERRRLLLEQFPLDRASLEHEVTSRQVVVVCSGGGGSGYGLAGAFNLLDRRGLQPQLLAGTSMGSIISLFRARHRDYEEEVMLEANGRLSWNNVFRVMDVENHYGL
ncbi:MAG: patatin-like phospholipase family protein, partial [Myxococcota bacterium]|nr:patatin-like phospholipase family protein [Myxococcota bacterium]